MPLVLPHTFADGPGNTASGVQVMNDLNAVNAGVAMATVTSLPGSPVNGQDCFYLADATAGVVWHLKYRSASGSAYKWEYVGGSYLYSAVLGSAATSGSGASYADLTGSNGPDLTVPLAGDYEVVGHAEGYVASGIVNVSAGPAVGVTAQPTLVAQANTPGGSGLGPVQFDGSLTALAAATVLRMRYLYTSVVVTYQNRYFKIRPVRVG